jgi:hypothetical protein
MATAPEPAKIRANTTVKWTRTIHDYDADDGWSAEYNLHAESLNSISIPTTGNGNEYTVDTKPATTTGWAAGVYNWILTVSDGTDTYEVDTGSIEVLAENATGNDLLDARAYLRAAEAEYQERVTGKASSYSIKDRSLTRMDAEELRNAIRYWRGRVTRLENEERARKGFRSNRITYARF